MAMGGSSDEFGQVIAVFFILCTFGSLFVLFLQQDENNAKNGSKSGSGSGAAANSPSAADGRLQCDDDLRRWALKRFEAQ